MIGDKLTNDLLKDINNLSDPKNKNINSEDEGIREENQNMSVNLKEAARKKKEEEMRRQQEQQSAQQQPAAETPAGEQQLTDEEKESKAKALLQEALKGSESNNNVDNAEMLSETSNFVTEDYAGMTEEEIQQKREERAAQLKKQEEANKRKLAREQNTKAYNEAIERAQADIVSRVSDIEISPEMETYQAACRAYGRHVCFLVAEGPAPKLGLSTKFTKENGEFVPREGVAEEDIRTLQSKAKITAEEKRDHYKFEVGLTYTYSKPKNIFGSIIELPQVLNLPLSRILKMDFPVVDQAEIEASPRILIPYSDEAFYSILSVAFGKEITESTRMESTKAARKSVLNVIKADINIVRVKSNNVYTGETKYNKVITSEGRKDLLVRENVIPYKIADTIRVSELRGALGKDTLTWYNASFAKKLGAGKGTVAPFSELNENVNKILTGSLDPDTKTVTGFTNKLLTGEVQFGQGAAKGLVLRHWSDTQKADDGTYTALIHEPILPRKVGTPKAGNESELTYKQAYKQLGINLTLEELAGMGYTAASELLDKHFDVQSITKLYASWAASVKQKRNANKSNTGASAKSTAKVNSLVDAETTQKLILAQLQGKLTDSRFDFDAESAKQSLVATSYIRQM